ncbi:hypothetical protein GIY23_03530 [Allosaccharopolyspora coralli]|uniref:Uncharacterized protein n=1 Tax=Allosaccharopolyspora coralli TaxID=2665642 RepID=A0A5Q3QC31_9PSEU|nr:hypothetical protein GIY23_03530 [Allosaccharopolyspora coralli]
MPRPGRLFVALAAAGLLLTGCGTGPGQPGAAAVVGGETIPVSDVRSWFDGLLAKEQGVKPELQAQGQMDDVARNIATLTVREKLAERAARAENITVSDNRVSEEIAARGGAEAATRGQIYTPRNFRDGVRAQLIATELGRKYADRLAVTFDYTQATTRSDAEHKARRMAAGAEETRKVIAEDAAAGLPAMEGERLRAAETPEVNALAAATPLFAADPGTVLAFQGQQAGQWLVARITERRTDARGPAPAPMDQETLQALGTQLLALTGERVGVELSPRYGVWDPIALATAPNEGETTGFRYSDSENLGRS